MSDSKLRELQTQNAFLRERIIELERQLIFERNKSEIQSQANRVDVPKWQSDLAVTK